MHASLLICALLAVAAQDKTYDLKLESKPVKGHKSEQHEKTSMKMVMKVNGQPAGVQADEKVFAAAEEILDVDADGQAKRRWTFTKATHLHDDKPEPYGFQGKAVIVSDSKGKPRTFTYADGGAVAEHDLEGLKEAFDDPKTEGKASGADLFAPPKPVKAGESWSGDVKKVVAMMFDAEMAEAVDLAKSKLSFTLKSVETRGGVEYGKVTGGMDLTFSAFGPLKLEQPMAMKFSVEMDVCVDGKLPDGVIKMKGGMKGKSPASVEANKVEIEIDMSMEMDKSVKTTK